MSWTLRLGVAPCFAGTVLFVSLRSDRDVPPNSVGYTLCDTPASLRSRGSVVFDRHFFVPDGWPCNAFFLEHSGPMLFLVPFSGGGHFVGVLGLVPGFFCGVLSPLLGHFFPELPQFVFFFFGHRLGEAGGGGVRGLLN